MMTDARNVGGRPEVGPVISTRLAVDTLERVDALAGHLDVSRAAVLRAAADRLTAGPVAVYELGGAVTVVEPGTEVEGTSVRRLGFHDADGDVWEDDLAALLARHGYTLAGPWSSIVATSVAPVAT